MDTTENNAAAETGQPLDAGDSTNGDTEGMATEAAVVDDAYHSEPDSDAAGEDGPAETEAAEAAKAVDFAELARGLLDQILQEMKVPATVQGEQQPDSSVRLLVEGPDMGVVIGKHGGTINALQYLIGLIIQKRTGERVRLVIDAEGYRSRREQALRDMARAYAQRVKESGQEAVLDALQSYERRIIHNSLSDDPDVFTYSEGEEPDRRVVISPRDAEPA
jgi:spoIIIJ-associated protein